MTLRLLLTRSVEKSASKSHSSHSSKAGGAAQGMLQHVYVDGATAKGWQSVAFSAQTAPAYACNSGAARQCIDTRLSFESQAYVPCSIFNISGFISCACGLPQHFVPASCRAMSFSSHCLSNLPGQVARESYNPRLTWDPSLASNTFCILYRQKRVPAGSPHCIARLQAQTRRRGSGQLLPGGRL